MELLLLLALVMTLGVFGLWGLYKLAASSSDRNEFGLGLGGNGVFMAAYIWLGDSCEGEIGECCCSTLKLLCPFVCSREVFCRFCVCTVSGKAGRVGKLDARS